MLLVLIFSHMLLETPSPNSTCSHHHQKPQTSPRYNPMIGESWSRELTRSGTCRHGGSHRRLALTHFGHKFEQNTVSCHGKENARQREHGAQQAREKRVHG